MRSLLIIYDGACPFCSAYVSLLRLRSGFRVELLSARSDDARVSDFRSRGYRLDEGMLVVVDQTIYVGAEAMQMLAVLSEPTGWLNRLQRAVFRHRRLSGLLYPVLRVGRRAALWLRRVPLIDAARPRQ